MLPTRRSLIAGLAATALPTRTRTPGERLARAARAQVGVTVSYDSEYRRLRYPGGDPPRTTGVCADVVVRAARDGLGLDLQRLVHEDMGRAFRAYPRLWDLPRPDPSIDHRRVPNLETYFRRRGAEVWRAAEPRPGYAFAGPLHAGDILTWRSVRRGSHIAVVVVGGRLPRIVHNIGGGAVEQPLLFVWFLEPCGLYRWPVGRLST